MAISLKHTPSPWVSDQPKQGAIIGNGGKGEIIAWGAYGADAELIKAAPDLLEALKELRNLHTDSYIHKGTDRHPTKLPPLPAVVMADAAIAKAEGRSKEVPLMSNVENFTRADFEEIRTRA